jgi:hypothetical protein
MFLLLIRLLTVFHLPFDASDISASLFAGNLPVAVPPAVPKE